MAAVNMSPRVLPANRSDQAGASHAAYPAAAGPPELESLDFDSINSPYMVDVARRPARTLFGYTGKTFARWVLTILIGVGVAFVARFLQFSISEVGGIRNRVLQSYFDDQRSDLEAFGFFITYNLTLVLLGALMTVRCRPDTLRPFAI